MKKLSRGVPAGRQGFTLIELLIVIGVLGILASGLLATVDPFEQLKKARDANNRNATVEMLNALTRYYATHGYLPWYSGTAVASCGTAAATYDPLRATSGNYPYNALKVAGSGADKSDAVNLCITNSLISDGELKGGFFSGLAATLYVASGSKTRVEVCYSPEGKALRNDAVVMAWTWDATNNQVKSGCTDADKAAGLCLQCFQ